MREMPESQGPAHHEVGRNQSGLTIEIETQASVNHNHQFVKKVLNVFCVFKVQFIMEMLRLAIYIGFSTAIFGYFLSVNHLQVQDKTFFTGDQVVHTPQIRGLFPPVKGSIKDLQSSWKVSFINSLQFSNRDSFNEFTLEFKQHSTHKLRVRKTGCKGDYMMMWEVFSFNMLISDYQRSQKQIDDMVITADQSDTKCILAQIQFFDLLRNVSVWAMKNGRLYLLAEKWSNNTTIESVVILETIP